MYSKHMCFLHMSFEGVVGEGDGPVPGLIYRVQPEPSPPAAELRIEPPLLS